MSMKATDFVVSMETVATEDVTFDKNCTELTVPKALQEAFEEYDTAREQSERFTKAQIKMKAYHKGQVDKMWEQRTLRWFPHRERLRLHFEH